MKSVVNSTHRNRNFKLVRAYSFLLAFPFVFTYGLEGMGAMVLPGDGGSSFSEDSFWVRAKLE